MSGSFKDINSLATSKPTILPGATLALFVDVQPGQLWTQIKNVGNTGGLEILQCSSGASLASGGSQLYGTPNFIAGSTLSAAMLVAMSGTGYPMGANEVVTLAGPARFYLATSTGNSGCIVGIIKGLGSGV